MVSCQICGKKLSNPASIALGIGPVCAAKKGILRLVDPENPRRNLHRFNFSCVCPWCEGTIEAVELGIEQWRWTCGGVTGDGCHYDFGINTPAPLKIGKRELKTKGEFVDDRFTQAKAERKFYARVAVLTKERLGKVAVPPYSSFTEGTPEDLQKILDEVRKEQSNEGLQKQERLDNGI